MLLTVLLQLASIEAVLRIGTHIVWTTTDELCRASWTSHKRLPGHEYKDSRTFSYKTVRVSMRHYSTYCYHQEDNGVKLPLNEGFAYALYCLEGWLATNVDAEGKGECVPLVDRASDGDYNLEQIKDLYERYYKKLNGVAHLPGSMDFSNVEYVWCIDLGQAHYRARSGE